MLATKVSTVARHAARHIRPAQVCGARPARILQVRAFQEGPQAGKKEDSLQQQHQEPQSNLERRQEVSCGAPRQQVGGLHARVQAAKHALPCFTLAHGLVMILAVGCACCVLVSWRHPEHADPPPTPTTLQAASPAPGMLMRPGAMRLPSLFREMEREMDALTRSFFGGDMMMPRGCAECLRGRVVDRILSSVRMRLDPSPHPLLLTPPPHPSMLLQLLRRAELPSRPGPAHA